jgi:hypothetical protein
MKGNVPNILAVLPEEFCTHEFSDVWLDFCDHRRAKRKPLTARAVNLIAGDFAQWGVAASIEAMNTSIKQGWTGVFEPRQKRNAKFGISVVRPMPMAKRNKIINELNKKKQMIYRTFPDGKLAPWAVERLASIDRQLQKL